MPFRSHASCVWLLVLLSKSAPATGLGMGNLKEELARVEVKAGGHIVRSEASGQRSLDSHGHLSGQTEIDYAGMTHSITETPDDAELEEAEEREDSEKKENVSSWPVVGHGGCRDSTGAKP